LEETRSLLDTLSFGCSSIGADRLYAERDVKSRFVEERRLGSRGIIVDNRRVVGRLLNLLNRTYYFLDRTDVMAFAVRQEPVNDFHCNCWVVVIGRPNLDRGCAGNDEFKRVGG
jgi:hypothetical protein